MEEKRREVGSPSPAATLSGGSSAKSGESPASEPPAPRRRGQKRKSIATTTSGSSSAPPKRQHVREKAAAAAAASAAGISSFLPPFHNGPLTRARQLSDTNAVLNAVKEETAMAAMRDTPAVDRREEDESRNEEFKEFQDAVDAEFEAIRSRDANSHVVPVATGWFSWTKLHPLEKHSLPSFFNGKSESRTPEVYMDIRNWIVKRFHANPSTNIELKDLSALSMGDSDARQEVLEFLDHWGLINYHPFPQNNSANADPHPDPDPNTDDDMIENTDSLIKKLFQFENEQSFPDLVPRANTAQPMPTGLLRESAIAEEFIKQEGPAVEYHCNSCSADCSRKRYHCQKQADFDLCTECFNNGKFGSGMSSSDFILMEPGEASGASGGKWTDQETLLLLEALELFKENWNEIAEHVATKTKAQCILHFLQMPIEDGFLDDNVTKNGVKDIGEPALASNDVSVPKDTLDPSEERNSEDNPNKKGSGSGVDNSELLATKAAEDDPEPSETQSNTDPSHATQPSLTTRGTPDLEEAEEGKSAHEKGDDVILKALMEAFDAVGFPVGEQDNLCFAEAGNSVMTVAAFLTQLVEPNLATASARTSLKSVSRSSPGLELSARHCFILEGPPDDKKELTKSEITATENGDEDAQNVVSQQEENCKEVALNEENITDMDEDRPATLLKGSHSADGQVDEKNSSDPGDNQGLPSASRDVLKDKPEFAEKLDGEKADVAESSNEKSQAAAKSDEDSGKENPRGPEKLDEEKSQVAEKQSETTSSEQAGSKGVIEPANRTPHSDQSHPDKEGDILGKVMPPLGSADVSGNMHAASEDAQSIDAHKDIDMKSRSVLSDKSEQQESVLADPVVGVGLATGEDKMDVDKSQDVKPLKIRKADDDENVAKLKRAALATLSAAAVKAKLLADQEEAEIKQLATVLIDKQVRKLEIKMNFFTEMEGTILRVREHLERSRQKLFAERAQIIASRLGIPPSARGGASSHPLNRMPVGLLNSVLRPSMNMGAQRPPMPRPVMAPAAPNSNTCAPPVVAGDGSAQPMAAEKPSPAATD